MIVAEFIASYRTEHGMPHAIACRALQVSQSWFYTHINRTPTSREQRRARLEEEIRRLFTASGGTYGSPRICDELREAGWKVSVNTVAARMAEFGLAGRRVKRRRSTARTGRRPAALDLVRRNFTAVAPDVLWCGDVTQIDTDEGPVYLAAVQDLFSRRMLGHAMSERHDAALAVASLQTAAASRDGDVDGVILHTDRGSEYTAAHTAAACRALGVVQSMGRVGCALDNAAAEAFNSTLKVEFVHRQHFTTRAEARIKTATWIADFYNTSRRHSANDGLAPITFERHMAEARRASTAQLRAEVA
ncbi:IS3 family transposase [Actinomadura madurae]|uniref:IS3 family transposase n=1 Tax=Actinomadura madurae TaxID=1993 RepID=UPI002026DE5D|nr:IS3 family transposase [Actinomadura madurae]URN01179.1 IS3 family transposase [Actinomadura madurae]